MLSMQAVQWIGCVVAAGLVTGCGAQPGSAPSPTAMPASRVVVVTPGPPPPNAEHNGRAWGPADAPITVLKFVDYQCPTCRQYVRDYDPEIVDAFAASGKVRFEMRILTFIGRESYDTGLAALCAADQNAFWPMHQSLFLNQSFDGRENAGVFTRPHLRDMAGQIGLDVPAFDQCMDSELHKPALDQDRADATRYGVGRVPALVVNDRSYPSARSASDLRQIFAEVAPAVYFKP